jgi:hypothetical protein
MASNKKMGPPTDIIPSTLGTASTPAFDDRIRFVRLSVSGDSAMLLVVFADVGKHLECSATDHFTWSEFSSEAPLRR